MISFTPWVDMWADRWCMATTFE
ncbi:uncharacterized protein METZ01_LOCUS424847 [marine metagenome]|uniref:Uncharacterized protein n=1 Tax=marine metagenome TaxID=408172 RepID=A0A382XM09_9ZZZZ